MRVIKYFYNPDFKKRINLFLSNPYASSLKTHKLSGRLKDYWAFSISLRLRIIFRFRKANIVEFVDFGGHEIYK